MAVFFRNRLQVSWIAFHWSWSRYQKHCVFETLLVSLELELEKAVGSYTRNIQKHGGFQDRRVDRTDGGVETWGVRTKSPLLS